MAYPRTLKSIFRVLVISNSFLLIDAYNPAVAIGFVTEHRQDTPLCQDFLKILMASENINYREGVYKKAEGVIDIKFPERYLDFSKPDWKAITKQEIKKHLGWYVNHLKDPWSREPKMAEITAVDFFNDGNMRNIIRFTHGSGIWNLMPSRINKNKFYQDFLERTKYQPTQGDIFYYRNILYSFEHDDKNFFVLKPRLKRLTARLYDFLPDEPICIYRGEKN